LRIQRDDLAVQLQIDALRRVVGGFLQRQPFRLRGSRQEVLGQIGAVDREIAVGAEHGHASVEALLAQPPRGGITGRATADDDDLPWRILARPRRRCRRARHRLAHVYDIAADFGTPAPQRGKCRCAAGRAGAQVEAGVVPGTVDLSVGVAALGQRRAVVRAMRADRMHAAVVQTDQQHGLIADMPGQRGVARDRGQRDAAGKIGAREGTVFVRHGHSLRFLSRSVAGHV
jgi:hypothetical protein